MQTNIMNNLDESGLNPDSSFFKQLRGLLCPDIEPINQSISFLPSPIPSASPTFDLQHVIDASKSLESERSSSPSPKVPETSVHPSQLYRHIYASSGKWDWMLGHNIVDENSTFLAAGAMCSTYYKKGKAAGRELKYICKSWKTNINWDGAFYSELALYKKQLKPLQGKCVPNVIGLFAAPGALNVAMEPPHSSFWIEASTDMPLSLKQRCVDAFAEIHSRGVFHGDVELRHMLIGGDARITIIDFQESSALEPNEKLFLRPATDADLRKEMRKVKVKLDYPGARDYEKEKRKRCLTRHKRNADQTRKVVLSRSYTPLLEMDTEDDILNPPVLDVQEWQDWNVAPSLPQIFVVPGQSLQQRIGAYEAFLASLKPPSRTPGDPVPAPFHYRPNGDLQQAEIRKRTLVLTDFEHSAAGASRPRAIEIPSPIERTKGRKEESNPSSQEPSPLLVPSPALDRLSLLRVLAELPPQTADDPLPSQVCQLLGAELARVRRGLLTRKRSMSPDDTDRPAKRTRLDDAPPESSASFAVVGNSGSVTIAPPSERANGNTEIQIDSSSGSPSLPFPSDDKFIGLGKFEWLPNFLYPPLVTSKTATGARVAMESLGQCAMQELPHPDLIRLYPHHPRWADPDVQIFLGRLEQKEKEAAWVALLNPDKTITGPRHPRAAGNLKRTLSEIQSDLKYYTAEELIRGQKRARREGKDEEMHASEATRALSDPSEEHTVRNNLKDDGAARQCRIFEFSSDATSPPRVRFVAPVQDKEISLTVVETKASSSPETSEATTNISHTTQSHCRLGSWYRDPFSLVTRVFSWV